jgi:hypothetical protein
MRINDIWFYPTTLVLARLCSSKMATHGPENDDYPPMLIRVPSNVVYAATPDAAPDTVPTEKRDQVNSETDSREEAKPEFKEGGYGW